MERREIGDTGPLVVGAVRWWVNEVAPGRDALNHGEEVTDLSGFQCSAFNASFVEEHGGIEEPRNSKLPPRVSMARNSAVRCCC